MDDLWDEFGRELRSLAVVAFYVLVFTLAIEPTHLWSKVKDFQPHILAVICTVSASYFLNRFLVWRQRKELGALIGIIYETFYGSIRPEDGTVYRVSCYQYHDSAGYRFWCRFWGWLHKKRRNRRPLKECPFLQCIVRRGHEGRKWVRKPTTLTMAVWAKKGWSEGFAGLVARQQKTVIRLHEKNITSLATRVRPKEEFRGVLREKLWEKARKGLDGPEEDVAWAAIEEYCDLSKLKEDEKKRLENFAQRTNTTPYLLLSVTDKAHCNNFFGFPVFKEDHLWGVVTIDALDSQFEKKMAKRLERYIGRAPEGPAPAKMDLEDSEAEKESPLVEEWIEDQLRLFATVFDDFLRT